MKISWSHTARNDLRNLRRYIAQDSPHYARQFTERIITAVEKLADFPQIGRRVPEAEEREDVRELIFRNYRILYLVERQEVQILAIIHGSRDLATHGTKPWEVR